MHTMQEQPGRCLGCLVVVATDEAPGSLMSPPTDAAFTRASWTADSQASADLWLVANLLFLSSMEEK